MFDSHGVLTNEIGKPIGVVEAVRPPLPVWLDLAKVYPIDRRPQGTVPHGLDLQSEVPATVHLKAVTTTGHSVVWVLYDTREADTWTRSSQWVFSWAVSPRNDAPARKE